MGVNIMLSEENTRLRDENIRLKTELGKARSQSILRLHRIEYTQAHLQYEMSIIPKHTQHWAMLNSALNSLDV